MTNELSIKNLTPKQQLVVQRKNEIQNMEADLKKMLPPSLPSDKFIRTVQTAIALNPDIAEADKTSVLSACMKAAADGLVLDGREAALTIYNTKQKDGSYKKMAQYIPMVAGIIKRVRNSGEVARLNAFVVYENDKFHVAYGLEMTLEHEPNFENPGRPLGAYAVCLFKDGEIDFEFMPAKQIFNIGGQGKNADQYDPSKGKNYGEWWRKTAIRRLSKRLPVDSDIARVVERIDEDYEFRQPGKPEPEITEDGEIIEHAPEKPAKARGAAAAKLNPKPAAQPEPEIIEQPESSEPEVPAHFDDGFENVI
jgi:recombination protein RecT